VTVKVHSIGINGELAATPARGLVTRNERGVRVLAPTDIGYADGLEGELLKIVQTAQDVSSLAGALISTRDDWAVRYHLSSARANCLRSLRLDPSSVVLEVGAGCGAITRWLGEQVSVVDALEPQASRAVVARERTRDLPGVEVFQGLLEHVPDEPTYDVIFVVGVLEYVGGGSAEEAAYVDFLASVRSRLRPGGTMVLAIENKLGVKYLAGAPEDHSGHLFHGVEGYHGRTPARTFDRPTLTGMAVEAGFGVIDVKSLFPDYKMTRAAFDDSTFTDQRTAGLTCVIPSFPSAPAGRVAAKVMSEGHLWRSLVEAEVGPTFANSFLLLASDRGSSLWPRHLRASFFSTDRHPDFTTMTELVDAPTGLRFVRRALRPSARRGTESFLHQIDDSALVSGVRLDEFIAGADEEMIAVAIQAWERLVTSACDAAGPVPIDLIPQNVLVTSEGGLQVIDQEWFSTVHTSRDVVGRGLLYLADGLNGLAHPYRFPGSSIGDLLAYLASMTSLDGDGAWLTASVQAEATFQAFVRTGLEAGALWNEFYETAVGHWVRILERPLVEGPLGRRDVHSASSAAVSGVPQPLRLGPNPAR
jgi:cyclopropane fatty-acyl-phospholipid synthase-like methyltransferase